MKKYQSLILGEVEIQFQYIRDTLTLQAELNGHQGLFRRIPSSHSMANYQGVACNEGVVSNISFNISGITLPPGIDGKE